MKRSVECRSQVQIWTQKMGTMTKNIYGFISNGRNIIMCDVSRNLSVRNYHSALRNVPEESRSQIPMYLMAIFHIIPRQFIFLFPAFFVSSFKVYFISRLCNDLGCLFTTITYNERPFKIYCYEHTYVRNKVDRDSSVGTATRYGLDGPGIESRWRRDFRTRPDRPWGPPSLLYNGYQVYLGGKAAGAWR